jgi:tRNA U34 5-methylaminomethyl-2-thiouridine-forming methyltransferase MnmC
LVAFEPFELIETEDGSLTCRDGCTGELYHNRAGAITEALMNYVQPASPVELLDKQGSLNLLDACFGLGYNSLVLLAALAGKPESKGLVRIVAVERDRRILSLLPAVLKNDFFAHLPAMLSGQTTESFELKLSASLVVRIELLVDDLRKVVPALSEDFDLIFHDPFSPKRVPELWTVDLFRQYRRLVSSRMGKVFTYSSAAAVRGGFVEAGFSIGRTPAVGGKSGGTAAFLCEGTAVPAVQQLSEMELTKMATRSAVPYRDPYLNGDRADILSRRELEQRARSAESC